MEAPDEIYLFRPNGTNTANGQIGNAQFSADLGRTEFNDTTNPSSFLINGNPGGINISNIGHAHDTINLNITVPNGDIDPYPDTLIGRIVNYKPVLFWTQSAGATGYKIYRNFVTIAAISAITTYRDETAAPGTTYSYIVTALYGTTESESSNIITLSVPNIVSDDDRVVARSEVSMAQNFPNPFNPTTLIEFTVSSEQQMANSKQRAVGHQQVTIEVFNIKGQKVRSLVDGFYESGHHSVVWNGADDHGRGVGSGVYLYRLESGDTVETRKMVLIK
jgi:hypothetical protein